MLTIHDVNQYLIKKDIQLKCPICSREKFSIIGGGETPYAIQLPAGDIDQSSLQVNRLYRAISIRCDHCLCIQFFEVNGIIDFLNKNRENHNG